MEERMRIDQKLTCEQLNKLGAVIDNFLQVYFQFIESEAVYYGKWRMLSLPIIGSCASVGWKPFDSIRPGDSLCHIEGHMIDVDKIGVSAVDLFAKGSATLQLPFDVKHSSNQIPSLPGAKILFLAYKNDGDYESVEGLLSSTAFILPRDFGCNPGCNLPDGFQLGSEIVIKSYPVFCFWKRAIQMALDALLAIVQPLLDRAIYLPTIDANAIHFIDEQSLSFISQGSDAEGGEFQTLQQRLENYKVRLLMSLEPLRQEAIRRNNTIISAAPISYDSSTMTTIAELIGHASKLVGHTVSKTWVYSALRKVDVEPVYCPVKANEPKGYPKQLSFNAIEAKARET